MQSKSSTPTPSASPGRLECVEISSFSASITQKQCKISEENKIMHFFSDVYILGHDNFTVSRAWCTQLNLRRARFYTLTKDSSIPIFTEKTLTYLRRNAQPQNKIEFYYSTFYLLDCIEDTSTQLPSCRKLKSTFFIHTFSTIRLNSDKASLKEIN